LNDFVAEEDILKFRFKRVSHKFVIMDKLRKNKETAVGKSAKTSVDKRSTGDKFSTQGAGGGGSVYLKKKSFERARNKKDTRNTRSEGQEEFDQRIVDIARVTRVMAGGKRMRFRACVAIGNKNGKVAIGLSKGADVTIAVTKAVNKAKKNIIDVPIINDTIPHEIYHKLGAAKILLKPARRGKGVIAGGAVHIILGLAGIKNITTKILGTHNKVNVAKCTVEALENLRKVEKKAKQGKGRENKDKKESGEDKNIKNKSKVN